MQNAIVKIFDVYDHAQQARNALLSDGFQAEDVTLSIANDEAGPVIGNFTVGNSPIESAGHSYDSNYANVNQPGQCVVTVEVDDTMRASRAEMILARFGARDADPFAQPMH
jgi:hypothetical protein